MASEQRVRHEDHRGAFHWERDQRASCGLQSVHSYWGRRAAAARLGQLGWGAHCHRAALIGTHCYRAHLPLRLLLALLALALAACAARGSALLRQRDGVRLGCARDARRRSLEPVQRPAASTQRGSRPQASRLTHLCGAREQAAQMVTAATMMARRGAQAGRAREAGGRRGGGGCLGGWEVAPVCSSAPTVQSARKPTQVTSTQRRAFVPSHRHRTRPLARRACAAGEAAAFEVRRARWGAAAEAVRGGWDGDQARWDGAGTWWRAVRAHQWPT